MPSQYRPGESAGLASVQMLPPFSYAMPCTPQAHCRYEPPLSYQGLSNLSALGYHDAESWFPATTPAWEVATTRNGSPHEMSNLQQLSELPVESAVEMIDTRWSPLPGLNYTRAAPTDVITPLHGSPGGNDVDVKPAVSKAAFSNGSNAGPWSRDQLPNPVTVASEAGSEVALSAPIGTCPDPTPAEAPPRPRPRPRQSSSAGAHTKSTSTSKTKGARGVRGKGKSVSAPVSPSELRGSSTKTSLAVQKPKKKAIVAKRSSGALNSVVSQRESHICSERERRKGMNYLFNTLRCLLPHPVDKTDKSTVVGEIIKYIQSLQVKLEVMTTKQQVMLATRSGFRSSSTSTALPKVLVSNGLTLVDHSSDPSCATAVTALPPPGKESCLQSFLGANVGIHACGRNVFITTSSPRGRRGLFQELLLTIHRHDLDIINATISTSNASIFHCLHCQASQDAEPLNTDLHSALQSVIANSGSQLF